MKGSIWRKWDLHLHTPETKLSDNFKLQEKDDVWDKYCIHIEESDVSVFGITDYFCSDNYWKFIDVFRKKYPNSKKIFFPNIEFRLPISVNRKGEEVNIHIIFDNTITKLKIDEFLMSVKTHVTDSSEVSVKCKNLRKEDFVSATVSLDELKRSLKEVFGISKPYLIVAAANNAGLRPTNSPRKLSITDEIDRVCDAFFGGIQNVEYYLDTSRYEDITINSKPKPVLTGCDAHSFEDMNTKLGQKLVDSKDSSIIISTNTWIKADCTFEGLKQVLYEPKFRILLQENEPRSSNRKINYIQFSFPSNINISRKDSSDSQDFCLKNLNSKIYFSDYFTCLVGGRGTGKSTIINLIAEKLKEPTDFFKGNRLVLDNKNYDIPLDQSRLIEISGTNEIEFVSQGKIENLAEGNRLTEIIFNERIKTLESKFDELDNAIDKIIGNIDANIRIISDINNKSKTLKTKNNEKETIQKIIDSVNDEEYKDITKEISRLKKETNSLESNKSKYIDLLEDIRLLALKYKTIDETDAYAERHNEILNLITDIDELQTVDGDITLVEKNYQSYNEKLLDLNKSFASSNSDLKNFFIKKGTSEDVIKDAQNANEKNARLVEDIRNIELEINVLINTYELNNSLVNTYDTTADSYEKLIASNLAVINARLDIQNENLMKIEFANSFDIDKFKGSVFDEFYSRFSSYNISGTSKNDVKRALFELNPLDILTTEYKRFLEEFETRVVMNSNRTTNYIKILEDIFKEAANYKIYQLIVTKHKFNVPKYQIFRGLYGGKDLMSCSFGQRCTAVVVTLLMTGIKPLIIDEPEAHLDNRLVAEYLVELIKMKKLDRQIIFATHNSNFVVNGDAELIHILEVPHIDIYTSITSTTIENIKNRDKLLRLEGGKEAFKIRECKYAI
ncbi:TrlF family AAA-like ATPase [Sphingobacterium paludis]|uniref:Putative AbiEii toxin of type IV toxin-antitoxin system n=1 Tax=Sphingobacterium paludis TaxID=1476465 RepID=A0A4R7D2E6_9SPHI|nr:AAA family ATPase [Sphingobacterium paludis]TDS14950.1 putative AbiEii toxin of type IV toxin-antitoxin system [Sphingobacterium paludis]